MGIRGHYNSSKIQAVYYVSSEISRTVLLAFKIYLSIINKKKNTDSFQNKFRISKMDNICFIFSIFQ